MALANVDVYQLTCTDEEEPTLDVPINTQEKTYAVMIDAQYQWGARRQTTYQLLDLDADQKQENHIELARITVPANSADANEYSPNETHRDNADSTYVLRNELDKIKQETNLPVGTIISFDAVGWRDNITRRGWYACVGQTITLPDSSRYTLPDLRDVFLKGSSSSGQTGGSNSYRLSVNQMPAHAHDMSHGHGPSGNEFTHTGRRGIHSDYHTGYAGSHVHAITGRISNMSGNTGSTGGGQAIDNQPKFYTVIQIRRCF